MGGCGCERRGGMGAEGGDLGRRDGEEWLWGGMGKEWGCCGLKPLS